MRKLRYQDYVLSPPQPLSLTTIFLTVGLNSGMVCQGWTRAGMGKEVMMDNEKEVDLFAVILNSFI